MRATVKIEVLGPCASPAPVTALLGAVGASGVSLAWLKRYSSPKPLRRPPTPKDKKSN